MAVKTPSIVYETTDTFSQLLVDLNTNASYYDSDLRYLDSAIGDRNQLTTEFTHASQTDLVRAVNELDSDLHGAGGGKFHTETTTQAKTVVGAINEIEAVFDANAGKITTDSALAVITVGDETHTVTGAFEVNADQNITLDADGNNIIFKDGAATRLQFTMGATNTLAVTNNLVVDAVGDITLDADGNDIIFKNGAGLDTVTHTLADNADYSITYPSNVTHTQTAGALIFDIPGDITLDADGNDIIFKNGAGGDTVTHTLADDAGYTVTYPGNVTNTIANDLQFNVTGGDIIWNDGAAERIRLNLDAQPSIIFTGTGAALGNTAGNFTIDAVSNIVLDADDGHIYLQDAGSTFAKFVNDGSGDLILQSGSTTALTFSGAAVEIAGNVTLGGANVYRTGSLTFDVSSDIILDAGGSDIDMQVSTVSRVKHTLGATNTVTVNGNYTLDVSGDITLDADGNDIVFKNGAGADTVTHTLTDLGYYTVAQSGSGDYTLDVGGDIILDANGGDILLKDNAVLFAALVNSGGNLVLKSAGTPAMTFNGGSVTVAGSITLPSTGTGSITSSEISATTVHGAIDEVNQRIPNVYNRSGTLLNP